jgi:cytochrome oxidase assembly protein ShyY1
MAALSLRKLVALLLLAALGLSCLALGRWQLRRAAEREAIAQAIETGRKAPPLTLTANTPQDELREWRPASAEGVWLDGYSVLLDNRNRNGRPGLWLATPLRLSQAPDTAVLVLRGWLPRPIGQQSAQLPPASAGVQNLTGQLRAHVPQLYELWQRDGRDNSALPEVWRAGEPPLAQNLDLARYARATGLKLLPAVLEQTGGAPTEDTLMRDWPAPPLNADQNRGYALQWFSFAAIAIAAALFMLWRALRAKPAPLGG